MATSSARLQKTAYFLIIMVIVFWILNVGSFIIVPLIWGIFFSFALFPLSNWLEEKRIPRGLAIVITLVLVAGIASYILYVMFNQVMNLILDVPEIKTSFNSKVKVFFAAMGRIFGLESNSLPEIGDFFATEKLDETFLGLAKSLTLAAIIPFFIFLMLYYKDFFLEFLKKVSSGKNQSFLNWIDDSGKVIQSYLVGILIVTGIVSIMSGMVFYFLGIKYYILFAVFIGVMNLIPFVGVIISSFLVVAYVLVTTDSLFYPFMTLFLLWIIQLTENNLITPIVVGSKVKLNTLVVILAIIIGGSLWGVSGMILFIPLIGVLKITLDRTPSLAPYGYLLGDKFPVNEKNENYWKLMWKRKRIKKEA